MIEAPPTVYVVDDDAPIREALDSLLRSVGLGVQLFSSPQAYLLAGPPQGPGCLILDVRMPGMSGLDLQKEIFLSEADLPIVFITAHGDIPMTVAAMKAGAVGFLTKPFRDQDLIDAVQTAIELNRLFRPRQAELMAIREHYATLTPREREVLKLLVVGKLNKQVAAFLGVSEITVKVHRAQVMRKMNAPSLIDLARMIDQMAPAAGGR
jgi:FixJ family two-component response regulator